MEPDPTEIFRRDAYTKINRKVAAADHSGFVLAGWRGRTRRHRWDDIEAMDRVPTKEPGRQGVRLWMRAGPINDLPCVVVAEEEWSIIAPFVREDRFPVRDLVFRDTTVHSVRAKRPDVVFSIVEQWLANEGAKVVTSELPQRILASHGSRWAVDPGKQVKHVEFRIRPDGEGSVLAVAVTSPDTSDLIRAWSSPGRLRSSWRRWLGPLWDRLGVPRAPRLPRVRKAIPVPRLQAELASGRRQAEQGFLLGPGLLFLAVAMYVFVFIPAGPALGTARTIVNPMVHAFFLAVGVACVKGFYNFARGVGSVLTARRLLKKSARQHSAGDSRARRREGTAPAGGQAGKRR